MVRGRLAPRHRVPGYRFRPDMKTLILGLGNPLLSDDGVGWRVAEQVRALVTRPETEVDTLAGGGLSLMERLVGYDRAIIVDALTTGKAPVGTVSCFDLEQLADPVAGHLSSAHETSLKTALKLGASLGLSLPARVMVVAIEAQQVYDFSEELSPAVAAAVPEAVRCVVESGWL
jgi:hydrogenase maturation protease